MVMNSHHHRWATRRTISATQNLKKNHAVHVPTHNGQRVKHNQHSNKTTKSKNSVPGGNPDTGRGSFDSFFAVQFSGPKAEETTTASQLQSKPVTNKIQSSPYSPHLFTSLQLVSQLDQSHFGEDSAAYHSKVGIKSHNDTGPIWTNPGEIQLQPVHAYFADLGLPCGSVHNTLSHLYAAEKLWQHRWTKTIPDQNLTKLWSEDFQSSDHQWSTYSSADLNLPIINLDSTSQHHALSSIPLHSPHPQTKHLLSMSLEEQDELAQVMMNKLSFALDDQNTHWISLIQGTTEPDLFNDLSYFDTSYIPSRLGTEPGQSNGAVIMDDFETDKTKLTQMPRLVALNHLFMHATHHRSQMLTVASQFTGEQTVVDLSVFVPEWKQIHSKVFRWA